MHGETARLTLSVPALYGFLLVAARVGGALSFVPLPGFSNGADMARVLLALSLTVALAPLWPTVALPEPPVAGMAAALGAEAAFGLTVGLAVAMLIETLLVAAQIFGLPAGFLLGLGLLFRLAGGLRLGGSMLFGLGLLALRLSLLFGKLPVEEEGRG